MEGDIADRVVFENEKIHVWELNLEPGESTVKHTHENDYLFYVYSPSTLKVTHCDDNSEEIIETHAGHSAFILMVVIRIMAKMLVTKRLKKY